MGNMKTGAYHIDELRASVVIYCSLLPVRHLGFGTRKNTKIRTLNVLHSSSPETASLPTVNNQFP